MILAMIAIMGCSSDDSTTPSAQSKIRVSVNDGICNLPDFCMRGYRLKNESNREISGTIIMEFTTVDSHFDSNTKSEIFVLSAGEEQQISVMTDPNNDSTGHEISAEYTN